MPRDRRVSKRLGCGLNHNHSVNVWVAPGRETAGTFSPADSEVGGTVLTPPPPHPRLMACLGAKPQLPIYPSTQEVTAWPQAPQGLRGRQHFPPGRGQHSLPGRPTLLSPGAQVHRCLTNLGHFQQSSIYQIYLRCGLGRIGIREWEIKYFSRLPGPRSPPQCTGPATKLTGAEPPLCMRCR